MIFLKIMKDGHIMHKQGSCSNVIVKKIRIHHNRKKTYVLKNDTQM